ncbi:MAG: YceI family protein [Saprospiraceae bacterium]|nr:YceI family protein [Candidatus Opimibacter iunctus]
MTKLFLALFFAAGFIVAAHAGDPVKGELKVNTAASKVEWTARKVTGKHNGTVNIKEGVLQIKDGILLGGSFTIDMTSIAVTDLTGEYKGKLEGHLKSDDFFGVEKFPTAKLVITQANAKGDGQFEVKGNITIRDVTQPITFTTQLTPDGKKYNATTSLTIDRAKFNVKYGSGSFFEGLGDSTIYDEFDLAISLVTE